MKFIHTADLHLDSLLKGMSTFFDAPDDAIRSILKRHATN
jgi:DNA repair exonuclease SbcCD nuclease subunit